jgi:hypothetical protein
MEEQTTEQTNGNEIILGDLVLMHNIIATVSRRGGFEASEFKLVGSLFEKLKTYIPAQEDTENTAETTNTASELDSENQLKFEFVEGEGVDTVTE